jgi:hypothetical protein
MYQAVNRIRSTRFRLEKNTVRSVPGCAEFASLLLNGTSPNWQMKSIRTVHGQTLLTARHTSNPFQNQASRALQSKGKGSCAPVADGARGRLSVLTCILTLKSFNHEPMPIF